MHHSILRPAAGLIGAAGVAGAAYAAHGGDARLAGTAAAIALVHAPAILAVGLHSAGTRRLGAAAALWIGGVLLFSGALFLDALWGISVPSAPVGGTLLILGWLLAGSSGFGRSA